jgi:hypothetical protein
VRKCDNAVVGEKLTRYESSVRGWIVIMEQPIARAPQFRPFTPECPASDGEEHCSRIRRLQSGLRGKIRGTKSLECLKTG